MKINETKIYFIKKSIKIDKPPGKLNRKDTNYQYQE